MSALTLTLIHSPQQRIDMSPLSCHLIAGKSKAEIGGVELQSGKRKFRVDELFAIAGDDTQDIVLKGTTEKFDYIGKQLSGGQITVEGDAGAYLAMGMLSGQVKITGNAGLYAGCEMKKGFLEISGNTGDFLGGALPGNKMGMKGGLILVKGSAGERVGDHLRKGMILIEGNTGDYCGSRMIAGTIAVMGQTGKYAGYAMRRGTLLLWNQPDLSASFNDCGMHTLAFLPMVFKSLKQLNSKFANADEAFNRVRRFAGDMSEKGKGEVLIKL